MDTTGGESPPVVRNALLLEDDDDVKRRVGATGESRMEQFTTARELFAPADTVRLAFAQAMIANFDWCLRFYPDDTYRCDAKQPLWNISAFKRDDGRALPVIAGLRSCGHGRRPSQLVRQGLLRGIRPVALLDRNRGSQPAAADALPVFTGAAG